MEPIITIEGYNMMQSSQQSRILLNDYYRQQGYEVVTPKTQSVEEVKPQVNGGQNGQQAQQEGNH